MAKYKNKKWLHQKYTKDGCSLREIGRLCGGTTHGTIKRWVDAFGIQKPYDDPDLLHDLYIKQGLSCRKISTRLKCGKTTIRRRLKKFGIKRPEQPAPKWHSKDLLYQKYVVGEKTTYEIAEEWGCHQSTIFYALKNLDIPTRPAPNTLRGEDHPSWRGKSDVAKAIRGCLLYENWRYQCFERDDYTCQECGRRGGDLNADHIKPLALILEEQGINNLEDALECEILWDTENAQTLCVPCHRKTETYSLHAAKQKELFDVE